MDKIPRLRRNCTEGHVCEVGMQKINSKLKLGPFKCFNLGSRPKTRVSPLGSRLKLSVAP